MLFNDAVQIIDFSNQCDNVDFLKIGKFSFKIIF